MINAINGLKTGFSINKLRNNTKNIVNNNKINYTQISKNASNAISSNALGAISFKGANTATADYLNKVGQLANIEVEAAKKEADCIMKDQTSELLQQASLKYSYADNFLLNMAKQRKFNDFMYPNNTPYIHFETTNIDGIDELNSICVFQNDGRIMTQAIIQNDEVRRIIDYTNHLTGGKVDVYSYENAKLTSFAKGCQVVSEQGETFGVVDEEFLFDKNQQLVQYSSNIKTDTKGKVFVGKLIEYNGDNLIRFQSDLTAGKDIGKKSGRLLLFDDSLVIYHQGWKTGVDGSILQGKTITFSDGEMTEFEEGYSKNHIGQEFFGRMFEFSKGKIVGYSSDYTIEPSGKRSKISHINMKKGVPNNLLNSVGVV